MYWHRIFCTYKNQQSFLFLTRVYFDVWIIVVCMSFYYLYHVCLQLIVVTKSNALAIALVKSLWNALDIALQSLRNALCVHYCAIHVKYTRSVAHVSV